MRLPVGCGPFLTILLLVVAGSLEGTAQAPQSTPSDAPTMSPLPIGTPTVADAKVYARRLLGPIQYMCLDMIVTYEDHWNPRARNPSSGAYGLPQAYPAEKMAAAGSDWQTNPITQLRWMIEIYIPGRASYGTPCRAWQHILTYGWY